MLFKKLRESLKRSSAAIAGRLRAVVKGRRIDQDLWDDVEEILITSDVGVSATESLVAAARAAQKRGEILDADALVPWIEGEMIRRLAADEGDLRWAPSGPTVVLIAGVNGSGKTTSIAKLAHLLRNDGKRVMVAACDTFRAAAVDQLQIWAERIGVELVRRDTGSDPAAVAYDAADAAVARGIDVLIVDTAGRLHTQKNLMEELTKITRVIGKRIPGAPHEVLLVLDGTSGQNGLQQTQRFREHAQVTGLILSKLDGTAKGGVVLSIRDELSVPVKFVGTGEQPEDFARFEARTFVRALFGENES